MIVNSLHFTFTNTFSNKDLFMVLLSDQMKINEKTLCSYWASNTPSDRQGWLYKRGEVNKSFQKRWCMLKGNLLFYGDKPTDKYELLIFMIPLLTNCTTENPLESSFWKDAE